MEKTGKVGAHTLAHKKALVRAKSLKGDFTTREVHCGLAKKQSKSKKHFHHIRPQRSLRLRHKT